MQYTQTALFASHLIKLHAEIECLQHDIQQIRSLPRGTKTPAQIKQLANYTRRLKLVIWHVTDNVNNLRYFTFSELVNLYSESMGWQWNAVERQLLHAERAQFEGKGEKPLRHRLGIDLTPTQEASDLPNGAEVKFIGETIAPFRSPLAGRRAYVRLLREIPDEQTTNDLLDGEVSANKIYKFLPHYSRTMLQLRLTPEIVLDCYRAIFLTTDFGFVWVPNTRFQDAFRLVCVTQMSPKYGLRREYVETELKKQLLPINEQSDIVAQQPFDVCSATL